jgi:hypothetical protein
MGNSRKKEKKTAVDWFAGEVDKLVTDLQRGKIQPSEYLIGFFNLRDKAKKKERKQIKDAYDIGFITPFDYDWEKRETKDAKQYYKETYGDPK